MMDLLCYADQEGNLQCSLMMHRQQSSASTYTQPHPASLLASGHGGYYTLSSYTVIITICVHSFHCHIFLEATLDLVQSVAH